jgi:hypothetical protein
MNALDDRASLSEFTDALRELLGLETYEVIAGRREFAKRREQKKRKAA